MMTRKKKCKKLKHEQSIEEKNCRKLLGDLRAAKRLVKYCDLIGTLETRFFLKMLQHRITIDLSKALDEWTKKVKEASTIGQI